MTDSTNQLIESVKGKIFRPPVMVDWQKIRGQAREIEAKTNEFAMKGLIHGG